MNDISKCSRLSTFTGVIGLLMTFFRVIVACLCIPLVMSNEMNSFIVGIVVLIMVCDYYDGKLFRQSALNDSKKCRRVRRIADSCGDRICIQAICIPLLLSQSAFVVPYLLICCKEFLSSVVCVKSFLNGYIIYPSKIAKISTILVGVTVIAYLIWNSHIASFIAIALIFGGIASWREYKTKDAMYKEGALVEGVDYEIL